MGCWPKQSMFLLIKVPRLLKSSLYVSVINGNSFCCNILVLFSHTSQDRSTFGAFHTHQNNARLRYDWFIWEEFQEPPSEGFWGYPMSICFLCPPTRNADRLETKHAGEEKQEDRVRWLLGDAVSRCGPCKQRTCHASRALHAKPQEFPLSHTFPPACADQ